MPRLIHAERAAAGKFDARPFSIRLREAPWQSCAHLPSPAMHGSELAVAVQLDRLAFYDFRSWVVEDD
jgi:hypothetical protein